MNILLLIVACVILGSGLNGYVNGFIKTTFRFLLKIILLVASRYITPIVFQYLLSAIFHADENGVQNVIVFLIIYALLWFGLNFVINALDIIAKLPILKTLNRTLGLFMGIASGLLFVWLYFMILPFFQTTELYQWTMTMVEQSQILTLLFENNWLYTMLQSLL